MGKLRQLAGGIAAAALVTTTVLANTASAQAADELAKNENESAQLFTRAANDGTTTEDKLLPNHMLSNSGYRLEMQSDGNLVLYNRSNSPCWNSGTNGARGAYADYSDSTLSRPTLRVIYQGDELRKYEGRYTFNYQNGNLTLNDKGEVWIAYHKFAHCLPSPEAT